MKNAGEIFGFFAGGSLTLSQVSHFQGLDWFWTTVTILFIFLMIIIGGMVGIFIQDIILPIIYKTSVKKYEQWNGKKTHLKRVY